MLKAVIPELSQPFDVRLTRDEIRLLQTYRDLSSELRELVTGVASELALLPNARKALRPIMEAALEHGLNLELDDERPKAGVR